MKTKKFFGAAMACLAVGAMCVLPSCKGKDKTAESDTTSVESVAETPVQPLLLTDSLANIYNRAFFDDVSRKADTPSDSTWTETASGLKYVMVKEGTGAQPAASDMVTVHYTGRLLDGTVFDTSTKPRAEGQLIEPAQFPLSGVIPGWTEGLQYMKEGGVAVFYIPADIAYGERGGGPIPPNSDLIFDVQLYSVDGQAQGM